MEENFDEIVLYKKKDKEEKLNELIQTWLLNGELNPILKRLIYLDLATYSERSSGKSNISVNKLGRTLSNIILETKKNIETSNKIKITPRKRYWRVLLRSKDSQWTRKDYQTHWSNWNEK